jgi:hypothetical protein
LRKPLCLNEGAIALDKDELSEGRRGSVAQGIDGGGYLNCMIEEVDADADVVGM